MEFTYDSTTTVNGGCQPQLGDSGSILGVGYYAGALSVRPGDPLFPCRRDMPRCCTDRIAEQQTLIFSLDNDTR
jgi:hypothetical protein